MNQIASHRRAVVVLSGGQDSTTCLYWAKQQGFEVYTITFNYGQRHRRELLAASDVAEVAEIPAERRRKIDLPSGILLSSSPLVDHAQDVEHYDSAEAMPGGIEPTFVPHRNLLFLTLAANYAVHLGARDIVVGVSQEDFGGYPDCRESFVRAAERAVSLAVCGDEGHLRVQAPLINLTKRETVLLAIRLDGCMDALAYSHTCYDGEYPPNPRNHASMLRARGFREANVADPLIMRAIREGLLPATTSPYGDPE